MHIKRVISVAAAGFGLAVSAGCATIVHGNSQNVTINSDPSGADVSVDGTPIGQTPVTTSLKRGQTHQITLAKAGYGSKQITLSPRISDWAWGNVATAFLGVGVDSATGALYDISPDAVDSTLAATTVASAADSGAAPAAQSAAATAPVPAGATTDSAVGATDAAADADATAAGGAATTADAAETTAATPTAAATAASALAETAATEAPAATTAAAAEPAPASTAAPADAAPTAIAAADATPAASAATDSPVPAPAAADAAPATAAAPDAATTAADSQPATSAAAPLPAPANDSALEATTTAQTAPTAEAAAPAETAAAPPVETPAAAPEPVPAAPTQVSSADATAATDNAEATAPAAPVPALPPPARPVKGFPVSTLRKQPVNELYLGNLRVELEQTSLDEVAQAAGAGLIAHDASNKQASSWLCYTLPDPQWPQRLWLISSQLNGGVRIDDIYAAGIFPDEANDPGCPALPAALQPVRFDNNVWLGSTENDLLKRFGAPGLKVASVWSFAYTEEHSNYKSISLLETQIRDGRVTGIRVARSAKY